MNTVNLIANILRASAALLATAVGILFSADDDESKDRSFVDGSDRFGEHNFRTGRMDPGNDPDGWYEEDL